MSFKSTVDLYRACGRPTLDGFHFSCSTNYPDVRQLVLNILTDKWARFDDLYVDERDVLDELLPENGQVIKFSLRIPTDSSATFHQNLACLLELDSHISRGQIPDEYYLIDSDYYTGDREVPENVNNLDRVCRLVVGLSKLAPYHDEKPSGGYLRLVFLLPGVEVGVKPIELETRVQISVVEAAKDLDPRLVEELSASDVTNDHHHSAKLGVFSTSLATFIGSPREDNAFLYLITHWQDFILTYQRDLSTYLSGFAFHKAKTEVAEAELKIAGEFSKVLNELTGKLLSIPISVAAIIAIPKSESFIERLLLVIGFFIASLVIFKTIGNQKRQFSRIINAKNLVLGAIEGRKNSYPQELIDALVSFVEDLQKDEKSLRSALNFFSIISWLPFAISVCVLGYVYRNILAHFYHALDVIADDILLKISIALELLV